MSTVAKKLVQTTLDNTTKARYTTPQLTRTHVSEIWLSNVGDTERVVTVYAHGLLKSNTLIAGLTIKPGGTEIISDSKIVLDQGEVLGMKQDEGSDIIMTAYGVEVS